MSDNSMYKANALRVLSKIVDKSNFQSIEKLIKTSLNDKNTHVKSSALVSCIHLFKEYPEMVKKFVGDIQTNLMAGNKELQYHALLLLHEIKKDDPMAILKVLSQLKATQTTLSSKLAKVQLIRYIKELLTYAHLDHKTEIGFVTYLNECLSKNADMVSFEAAKSICELSEKLNIDHEAAFKSILDLLVTGESILKFSALKVLNRLATINPKLVSLASSEIEPLINDSNTSIASMAISTLLKVWTEAYVQKLLAQISHYLPDLGDDFKIEVIHSVYLLFCRVPTKSQEQINFLLKWLTGEGTEGYKESIVEALMKIGLEGTKSDLEQVLLTLCEFIEDCDFKHLQTHIMNFIANESYKTSTPSIYIRFIYKRVVLEKSIIRAAAVSALGTMAHKIESLRNQIVILLKNCSKDENDEVRERVLFYIDLLDYPEVNEDDYLQSSNFTFDALNFDPAKIENYLLEHKNEILDDEENEAIFDFSTFCSEEDGNILTRAINKEENIFTTPEEQEKEHNPLEEAIEDYEDKGHIDLNIHLTIDEKILESIGISHVEFSTGTTDITSPTDEYFVQVTKHFYHQKIIFVFSVKNNIEEHKLTNIKVNLQIPSEKYNVLNQLSSDQVGYPTIVLSPKDSSTQFATDEFKFKLYIL